MVRLGPGESYNFDTEWFPTRADKDFQGVTDAGVILKPLRACRMLAPVRSDLLVRFGVSSPGNL